jgi:hypothetical protein
MDVLPYFIQRRLRSSRPNSLDKVLDRKRFSIKEIAFIVHNVVSYIEIVHEHGLVLDGQVSVENIDVPLTSDLKVKEVTLVDKHSAMLKIMLLLKVIQFLKQ